jgi:hypothetical protein
VLIKGKDITVETTVTGKEVMIIQCNQERWRYPEDVGNPATIANSG